MKFSLLRLITLNLQKWNPIELFIDYIVFRLVIRVNVTILILWFQEISYYLTRSSPNTILLNRVGYYDNTIKDKYGNPNLRYYITYSFWHQCLLKLKKKTCYFRLLIDNTLNFNDNITLASADENSLNSYFFSPFGVMDFNTIKVGK